MYLIFIWFILSPNVLYIVGCMLTIIHWFRRHILWLFGSSCYPTSTFVNWLSDGYSFKIDTFWEANFCTNDLILILKTPTSPYSSLAKVIIQSKHGPNVCYINCRVMKSVGFRTVSIWLHRTLGVPIPVDPDGELRCDRAVLPGPLRARLLPRRSR